MFYGISDHSRKWITNDDLFQKLLHGSDPVTEIKKYHPVVRGPGSSVGIATELRAGRSGDRIPVGRDFPLVQTGPGPTQPPVQQVPGLLRG